MRVASSFAVVFFHVCSTIDVPENLTWLVKFRDFALPVMVLSSFFVLTVSLDQKTVKNFRKFFHLRFIRLFIPLIVWTFVYTVFFHSIVAATSGFEAAAGIFSPVVFLTGYRHLYFRNLIWENLSADTDVSLQIFVDQTSRYFFYIPFGIGLGLLCKYITALFENAFFRRISLVLMIIAMLLDISFFIPISKEIYGVAIFLAALQPWKKIPFAFWKKLVSYSYGIYILHFFWAHLLWIYTVYFNFEITAATIVCATLIIYFLSFSCAVLIGKIFPSDWLMPRIKVKDGKYYNN